MPKPAPYPIEIKTERLTLRRIYTSDIGIFEGMSDKRVSLYEAWSAHETVVDTMQFINRVMEKYEKGDCTEWVIALTQTDTPVGMINLHNKNFYHGRAELGFWIIPSYWGKGYATEAARGVIDFTFSHTSLRRIESLCSPENAASVAVLCKVGMQQEGLLRKYMYINANERKEPSDIAIFSLIKE